MITLGIIAALITLVVGFVAKLVLDRMKSQYEIDNKEYVIVAAVMLILVIPLTLYVGHKVAVNSQVTYYENWNGWELKTLWTKTTCTRDGSCYHCYDCDPYTVQVPYDCGYYTGTGKNRRYVSKTCYRTETRYHHCPYTTEEWTFQIHTTVGDYTIAAHNLPTDPDSHRWRAWHAVPSSIPSGIPDFWNAARQRIDSGNPGPVTIRMPYDNYILASQTSIMKRYNDSVARWKDAGLLPAFSSQVHDFYYLNRVYFVGVTPSGDWQPAVNRFNAAFGTSLQGDLHLVIVDANKVLDPDNYLGSLMAYWESPAFGKNALSKNGMVVVLGTKDGKTVSWARAATGMPLGNEDLLVQIQYDVKGQALTPENLLGHPTAVAAGGDKVTVKNTNGVLEDLFWGKNRFRRVSMKGDGADKGFQYLLTEIEPTFWQKVGILFGVLFFAAIGWGIAIYHGVRSGRYTRN